MPGLRVLDGRYLHGKGWVFLLAMYIIEVPTVSTESFGVSERPPVT